MVFYVTGYILRPHEVVYGLHLAWRLGGVEKLGFLRPYRVRAEARRRLHCDEGEQLKQMIGHHVAQGPRRVIESTAAPDRQRLGHRDLDVIDVVPVPNRLEQSVGEAQHEDILDRFLSEIMIDAVDLMLFEDSKQFVIERTC